MKLTFKKPRLLVLLLLTDLIFISLHLIRVYTDWLPQPEYSLGTPRGFSEFFQYTKFLWVTLIFLILTFKTRRPAYPVFALLFLYFLIDDSFELHEQGGALIGEIYFQPAFGLRAVDFGELAVTGFFGALFAVAIGIAFVLSDYFERRIITALIVMILFLGLFGVVFDMVDVMVQSTGLDRWARVVEDGGEMIVASFMTWYAFHLDPLRAYLPLSRANRIQMNQRV